VPQVRQQAIHARDSASIDAAQARGRMLKKNLCTLLTTVSLRPISAERYFARFWIGSTSVSAPS
jgi:hypothetical protein